jgi:hypothetical protein
MCQGSATKRFQLKIAAQNNVPVTIRGEQTTAPTVSPFRESLAAISQDVSEIHSAANGVSHYE